MRGELRWGILGTAKIARAIVKALGGCHDSCVQAVASREFTRALEWAKELGVPRAFGTYEELLHSGEVDCVYIPLPNSLHAEWTIKALEAGLPVLCEKPFAANAAEAREVAQVARRTRLPVAEAFMYRHHPLYDRVLGLIQDGALGELITIRSASTFRLRDRHDIRTSSELAGGALMDVGCYCVSASRLFAQCEPERVAAFERRSSVDDTVFGVLCFPNGVLAAFECSIERYPKAFIEIEGTQGLIQIPEPWTPGEDKASFTMRRGDHEETFVVPGANCFVREIDDFVRACRTRETPRWGIDDAVANMEVIDALYRSAAEGMPIPTAR